MFDTIVIIPTILAYVFVSLLIVILSFIVVYISHRIYACIYDNLPVAHAALSAIFSIDDKSHSGIALTSPGSFDERKPKTAMRIIVTLAPSYLAYVSYANKPSNEWDIIKYYDRLSQIPIPEAATESRSRKLRHRSLSETSTMTSFIVSPTQGTYSRSVGTSITRLSSMDALLKELEEQKISDQQAEEEAAKAQQATAVEPVGAAVRQSGSLVRPTVTFVNAVNALANMNITTEENR